MTQILAWILVLGMAHVVPWPIWHQGHRVNAAFILTSTLIVDVSLMQALR